MAYENSKSGCWPLVLGAVIAAVFLSYMGDLRKEIKEVKAIVITIEQRLSIEGPIAKE